MCQYFLQKFFVESVQARVQVRWSEVKPLEGKGFARSPFALHSPEKFYFNSRSQSKIRALTSPGRSSWGQWPVLGIETNFTGLSLAANSW